MLDFVSDSDSPWTYFMPPRFSRLGSMFSLVTLTLACSCFAQENTGQPSPIKASPTVDAVQAKIVTALNAADGKAIYELLNEEMRKLLPADKAQAFAAGIRDARGKITS